MYYAVNDIRYARDRYNELLRQAEQYRLAHSSQQQQPTLLMQLQSKLEVWIDMARPQHNGDQRD